MSDIKQLVKENSDQYSIKEFNSKIKFTPVMKEVLLTLLVLFILNGTYKFSRIVRFLYRLLNRSPNAVGTALKSLAKLDLLDYYRASTGRLVALNLSNPFMESLTFRFFGFNSQVINGNSEFRFLKTHYGFIPSEENCLQVIEFFIEETKKLESKIEECLDYDNIIMKIVDSDKTLFDNETNPHIHFAQKIISEIEKKEETQAYKPTAEEISKIISQLL